uniref:NitT/TauT family transport system ATP-binding protein n=1 Tax=Candidatus Kentrum eta TaxID=2126337 RepID=A0A450VBM4_9GAMM|nr:MAG: NitT/TauT family transport system ATP-binding protein [Candidatus Kentron sp. H]VFJ96110.1 MAG: NitT/TauT family transport system ATP-binding protein [Candidatus Kentron sp. H]VFK02173.1 MAG: NitT/TauT family transport system ATP-binding protein [Candidatus Kentron sp. H]
MSFLKIENISKIFHAKNGSPVPILSDISMDVAEGEFISLFGPNGCGKSTLLLLMAGVEKPNSGKILLKGESVAKNNRVGMVFQNYRDALLPWRTNLSNLCLPLELEHVPSEEREKKGLALARDLGIEIDMQTYPYQLSGGQQQLLSLARAMISEPDFLLLDEPLSALDFQTRLHMADQIQKIWQQVKITTIFVSHDIEDAVYLSDKIYFLTERPAEIHDKLVISLPRPRTSETKTTKEFFDFRNQGLEIFRKVVTDD